MAELDDPRRLRGIEHYDALGMRGAPSVQRISRLAAAIAGTSSAAVHILTDAVQARIGGHNQPLEDGPVQESFCRLVIAQDEPVSTRDGANDPRFADSPHAKGPDPIRFYAALPLRTPQFGPLGTLCVWHDRPMELDPEVVARLRDLADLVVDALEANRALRRVAALATTDDLTGVANRRHVEEVLRARLAHGERQDERIALAFVDLDGFKDINDTHGHAVGDEVLAGVARALDAVVRTDELVGRIGGDEFVVIGEAGLAEASAHERLEEALRAPIPTAAGPLRIGASLGVALAEDDDTARTLLERADRAMFEVKAQRAKG